MRGAGRSRRGGGYGIVSLFEDGTGFGPHASGKSAAFAGRMPRSSNDGPCPRQPRLSRKGQGNRVGNRIPDGGWAFVTTSLSGGGTRPALARGYVRCPFRSAPAGIHGGDSPSGFLRREACPGFPVPCGGGCFPDGGVADRPCL